MGKMTGQAIKKIFNNFNKLNVLIIGDVMIDAYMFGKVHRISPEAPVPVVTVNKKEHRLGGAANVALNVQNLGANPVLCSVIGDDEQGIIFKHLLKKNQLETAGIFSSKERVTTVKTRVIGNNHQMLRVDEEIETPLSKKEEAAFEKTILNILNTHKIDVIVFEDYDKGCITDYIIKNVVKAANDLKIPTVVDPKKRNFLLFENVSLFKPNLKELKEGLKLDFDASDKKQLLDAVKQLKDKINCDTVLLTLSEHGVMYMNNKDMEQFPAHVRTIADVSGAGDTVVSVAAACKALKLDNATLAQLANIAGGLVCEKVGVVPIDKKQFLDEAVRLMVG